MAGPERRSEPTCVAITLLTAWFAVQLSSCASTPDSESVDSSLVQEAPTAAPNAPALANATVTINGAPGGLSSDVNAAADEFVRRYAATGKAAYVDDATYEIRQFLRTRGYAAATVKYRIDPTGAAHIDVAAGNQSTLGAVTVERDELCPLDETALALYVNGPRTGLFGTGDMLYVASRVAGAAEVVRRDLVGLGHLEATASIEDPGPTESGGPVDIRLVVRARARYNVSAVHFALEPTAEALTEDVQAVVDETLTQLVPPGEPAERPYDPRLGGRVRSSVRDAMASRGYPDAEVSVETFVDDETRLVRVEVRADPGPYVVLSEVRFEGSKQTKDKFMRSRFPLRAGDQFDARKLREGVRRLYRTGLFREIRPRVEGEGEARSLVIEVIEQESVEYYLEPGFGSYELFRATVGARDRNMFGSGIDGFAEVTVAVRALRAKARLSDPWFLGKELIGAVQVEFSERQEPSFVDQSRGVGTFVTKEWTGATSTTLGYSFAQSQAKDVEVFDSAVEEAQSKVNIAGITASQRYDVRDALFAPSKGFFAIGSLQLAAEGLGSELEFLRAKLTSSWFRPYGPNNVLGTSLRMGVIAPAFDESTIPIQERFFAGGENSVRSFMESELGPKDPNGKPLGGEAFATASIEWRNEVGGGFQTAGFVDAGFVEPQASDFLSFENVRYGLGIGLRYMLPIGPLRVDAAINPDPRELEDDWVIHFSIGMPF